MAKTELTKKLENDIYRETSKQGVFGCFEVTIGWFGKERVDYMTYDTKGIFRCYEIKVSKSDFHSKAKNTFIGHFNYYVMPKELYDLIYSEIPQHIGVYCGIYLVKRPKKQELKVDEKILKDSMIRSLSRECQKYVKTCDTDYINRLNRNISSLQKERDGMRDKSNKYANAMYILCDKHNIDHKEVREIIRDA